MKITRIFILLFAITIILTCEKSEDNPSGINYQVINKIITISATDSIEGTCKDLIFTINKLGENNYTASILLNDLVIPCDGFNNILANASTGKVAALDINQSISENDNWKSANGISLDDFGGKGEKYFGYRSGFYPLSTKEYYYGWIKVELSEDRQTLRIISRATNQIMNESIFAGQK